MNIKQSLHKLIPDTLWRYLRERKIVARHSVVAKICEELIREKGQDYFRNAEILHVIRYGHSQILAHVKEVINAMPGGENNSRMIQDGNALLSELLGGKALHLDKRSEYQLYTIFFGNIKIRRFFRSGLRL